MIYILLIIILFIIILKLVDKTENFTINNKLNIDPKIFIDNLTILSSNKEAKIVAFDIPLLNGGDAGFNILTFSRLNNSIVFNSYALFNIGRWCDDGYKMLDFLRRIKHDDIIIIVTNGSYPPFKLLMHNSDYTKKIMSGLKRIGAKLKSFNENSNYILITSLKDDIYYETISDDTVYYPYISVNLNECRIKPTNLLPLKSNSYIFADTLVNNDESKYRCALEASMHNLDKFALSNNQCLLIDDKMFNYIKNNKPLSDQCYMGTGSFTSASIYNFSKINNPYIIKHSGVTINNLENFKGHSTMLNEGDYRDSYGGGVNIINSIRSMIIPDKFIININRISIVGPIVLNMIPINYNLKNIRSIIVQKIKPNSVIFCENKINSGICYTYSSGSYRLPSELFANIRNIHITPFTRRINLYKDLNFTELIESFQIPFKSNILRVEFPRIVRSIEIL